jgi:hypothetical protein
MELQPVHVIESVRLQVSLFLFAVHLTPSGLPVQSPTLERLVCGCAKSRSPTRRPRVEPKAALKRITREDAGATLRTRWEKLSRSVLEPALSVDEPGELTSVNVSRENSRCVGHKLQGRWKPKKRLRCSIGTKVCPPWS